MKVRIAPRLREERLIVADQHAGATGPFFQDILIAATAHEVGGTIVTDNDDDFGLIGIHVDIAFVRPFPRTPAA